MPPAKKDVLVKLLTDFRAAGKRVVGWAVSADNLGYQVLCAADEVLLAPAGRLELVGYAAEATALGEGLGRVGIQAHFVRRGDLQDGARALHARRTSRTSSARRWRASWTSATRTSWTRGPGPQARRPRRCERSIDAGPYSAQRARGRGARGRAVQRGGSAPRGWTSAGASEKDEDDAEEPSAMESWLGARPFPPVKWRRLRRRPKLGVVLLSGMIVPGKGGAASWGRRWRARSRW